MTIPDAYVTLASMVAINIRNVPVELAREFKALCARRGESLRDGLMRVMAEELKRAGKREKT